jgi:hypothetical protein
MNGAIGVQPTTAAIASPETAPVPRKPSDRGAEMPAAASLTKDQVTTNVRQGMAATNLSLSEPAATPQAKPKAEGKPWGIRSVNFHYSPMVVAYAPSTMHFSQPEYGTDLTIKDVHAKQRTSFNAFYQWDNGYLQIDEPQASTSLGVQFNNGNGLEANVKHNKYIIPDIKQQREFSGTVGGKPVDGKHELGEYLDQYEICTGLNEISLEATHAFKLPSGAKDRFELISKAGPSVYLNNPRSRVVSPKGEVEVRPDGKYEIEGFGGIVENELRYEFRKHVSVSVAHSVSYTNLTSVPIAHGTASQQIWSNQFSVGLGYTFNTHKKH